MPVYVWTCVCIEAAEYSVFYINIGLLLKPGEDILEYPKASHERAREQVRVLWENWVKKIYSSKHTPYNSKASGESVSIIMVNSTAG